MPENESVREILGWNRSQVFLGLLVCERLN